MMHKTGIIVLAIVLAAATLFIIPIRRTFSQTFLVQAEPSAVYRALSNAAAWKSWYPAPNSDSIHVTRAAALGLHYKLGTIKRVQTSGNITITGEAVGGTVVRWEETVAIPSGLFSKLQLLLSPAHQQRLQESVKQMKQKLEESAMELNGVRFGVLQMKGHAIAAVNDTTMLQDAPQTIQHLYSIVRSKLPASAFTDTTRFTSRYKQVDSNRISVQVGLRLKDATLPVPPPLQRLEVPSLLVAVAAAKTDYADAGTLEQTMADWVQAHRLMLATAPWMEHRIVRVNGVYRMGDTLRIIQPFYHWPQPVTENY